MLFILGRNQIYSNNCSSTIGWVMNGKNLDAVTNMRIHRIMSKLIGYQFKVLWTPGKTHHIADAFSRAPVFKPEENQDILACRILVAKEDASVETIDPVIKRLIKQAEEDTYYQKVYEAVQVHNRLDSLPKDHPAQNYKSYWHAISTEQLLPKLIMYHGRILVPNVAHK